MARNRTKESSIAFIFLLFFFFTSLVDDALIVSNFMTLLGYRASTTAACRFSHFVHLGNHLLQVFGVIALLYLTMTLLELKSKRMENQARKLLPLLFAGLLVLEVVFALPPAFNVKAKGKHCVYIDSTTGTVVTGWLDEVLLPYFIPFLICMYPFVKIVYQVKKPDGTTQRVRAQCHIVLSVTGGFFFFNLLYYLFWLGRQIESLILDKSRFRDFLSWHVWYVIRPVFSLITLGWHISTPLAPFIFDSELLHEFPGPWVNKNRFSLHESRQNEGIVLQEHPNRSIGQDEVDAASSPSTVVIRSHDRDKFMEIHNPLPMADLDDKEYHQIPL